MRGMRPAKNPKARSNLVPRQIRSRRDAEEYEFDDEDYEALEDCDGTEEGAVAELCKQPRVSHFNITHDSPDLYLEPERNMFFSPFLSKKENSSGTPPPLSSGAEDTFLNVTVKEFMNTVSTEVLNCTKVLKTANKSFIIYHDS